MPACLRSQPSCHVSLIFVGYSNLLNGDILKMSNLKFSQLSVDTEKLVAILAASEMTREYLIKQKILPDHINV